MTRKDEIRKELEELDRDEEEDRTFTIVRNGVMEREKAKREGRDIIEDTDSGPDDVDLVVVEKHTTTVEL